MEEKSKELKMSRVVLVVVFAVAALGIGFGLGWYAKELCAIKQNQLRFEDTIEAMQSNIQAITEKETALGKEQLKLQGSIRDAEDNMEALVGDISETIGQNRAELADAMKNIREDTQKMVSGLAERIEKNQLESRQAIESVRNNTQEIVRNLAERIEKNQLEFRDVIVSLRENTHEIADKIATAQQELLDFRALVEQISREALGSSLEVISVEPSSPAVLNPGEKLTVKFRYRLGSSEDVQIWARPYTRGSRTRGYKAHGSPHYKKSVNKTGVAEGWFYFDEPTVVDEVRINMRDVTTGENVYTASYKIDARWVGSELAKKAQAKRQSRSSRSASKRICIDVNNPAGQAGWKDEYVIKLGPTNDIRREFGVNWFRPHRFGSISTEKPDFINALPQFKHEMQRYLTLRLGNAENNQIFGVMDFRKPDRNHFSFDLYLDRDRDGDLAEDFVADRNHITGICVPYDDGTVENYALSAYSYSTDNEFIGVAYQSHAGRYGILEADKKRIQLLVIDNSGNAIFNDDDDVILLDWDLDGEIDGSHKTDDDRPMYSLLKLPGGSYRVVEFDEPGRRMVIRREQAKQ